MSDYDFTYVIPKAFGKRVVQYLLQSKRRDVAEAFQRCKYEFEDVGLAYYAGLRGDNWNKKALDFTFEGQIDDISLLQSAGDLLKTAIGKALKPNESGYLVKDIIYFDADISSYETMILTSNEERLNADIESANQILEDIIQIGERICLNHSFNASSSENTINDAFRDMLIMKGYDEVKDQTRHGISTSGKDAGEVDILLTKKGKEVAIFEGIKLDSIKTSYIDEHIKKALNNYNVLGTATFIVAYVNSPNFEHFWERYTAFLQGYDYPLPIRKELTPLVHPNAVARIATVLAIKDGYSFPVYFIALKIS